MRGLEKRTTPRSRGARLAQSLNQLTSSTRARGYVELDQGPIASSRSRSLSGFLPRVRKRHRRFDQKPCELPITDAAQYLRQSARSRLCDLPRRIRTHIESFTRCEVPAAVKLNAAIGW